MGCGMRGRTRGRRRGFLEKLLHPGSRGSAPGPPPPFKVKCHSLIRLRVNLFRYLGTKRGKASYRSLRRPEVRSHLIHIQFDHQPMLGFFFFSTFYFCFFFFFLSLFYIRHAGSRFAITEGYIPVHLQKVRILMKFIHTYS